MEPADGPTKVCPECMNKVFETETVCGFCGHVFAEGTAATVVPVGAATKVCPECKAPVPAADTKCGICGHVFSAEAIAKAQSWPQTYQDAKWGGGGVYTGLAVVGILFVPCIAGLLYVAPTNPGGPTVPLSFAGLLLFIYLALAVYTWMRASNSSVTIYGDRIEWTTPGGKHATVKNNELSFGTAFTIKGSRGYTFGVENGPSRTITDSLDGFDDVVAEVEARLGR